MSMDGGTTFLPNVRVSDGISNAAALNPGGVMDFGDYMGMTFHGGVLHPLGAILRTQPATIQTGLVYRMSIPRESD